MGRTRARSDESRAPIARARLSTAQTIDPDDRRAPAGATLAELYALAEDRALEEQTHDPFGFARALVR